MFLERYMLMNNGKPFSILVVDDDEDDRMFIDEAFMKIGYAAEVKKFINGKMLLRYLEQIEPSLFPSLIVLDNTLPELEASDMLSILKSNPSYKSIPVVIYTSAVSPSREEELLSMGAYACLQKASTMSSIVQVARYLKHLAERDMGEGATSPEPDMEGFSSHLPV